MKEKIQKSRVLRVLCFLEEFLPVGMKADMIRKCDKSTTKFNILK